MEANSAIERGQGILAEKMPSGFRVNVQRASADKQGTRRIAALPELSLAVNPDTTARWNVFVCKFKGRMTWGERWHLR
jgi:hypothetical protein